MSKPGTRELQRTVVKTYSPSYSRAPLAAKRRKTRKPEKKQTLICSSHLGRLLRLFAVKNPLRGFRGAALREGALLLRDVSCAGHHPPSAL